MKRLISLITVLGLLAAPGLALAAPGIPHQFYGTVKYNNGTTPADGVVIEAKMGSTVVKSSTVSGGKYGYSPNLFMVTDPNSSRSGQTIKFYVRGLDTGKTEIFSNGGYSRLDLTVDAPADSSNNGGGGGGGSTSSSSPVPSASASPSPSPSNQALSEEAKKADSNNDGKIDVMDFNSLMIGWGSSGSAADFTGDGNVDVFDFNYLMIYWSY